MTKINRSEDCGNSPKNIFVQDLTIAFAKANAKFILAHVTDDIQWNLVGDRSIDGREALAAAVQGMKKADQLTVQHVTTHGKAGAVNGMLKLADGKHLAFCDVYEFGNTKGTVVRAITSYRIVIRK